MLLHCLMLITQLFNELVHETFATKHSQPIRALSFGHVPLSSLHEIELCWCKKLVQETMWDLQVDLPRLGLPIEWRIRFKLATLTYKALHTGRTPYLADLLQLHTTPKSTRSSSSQLLFVPRHHNLSFGSQAFRISAPEVCNTLPLHIRQSQSLSAFGRHLKTHYFQLAHPAT